MPKLDIQLYGNARSFCCTLSSKFWEDMSIEKKKEIERQRKSEFDNYLNYLSENYAKFFLEISKPEPEPNPLAGFRDIKDIPDSELQ